MVPQTTEVNPRWLIRLEILAMLPSTALWVIAFPINLLLGVLIFSESIAGSESWSMSLLFGSLFSASISGMWTVWGLLSRKKDVSISVAKRRRKMFGLICGIYPSTFFLFVGDGFWNLGYGLPGSLVLFGLPILVAVHRLAILSRLKPTAPAPLDSGNSDSFLSASPDRSELL